MKPTDYNFRAKDSILGLQFLFVAFGALVLVPILTGLDPSVALFTAGLGTLVFQFVNKGAIPPIFLASSFAFIAPISYGVATWGIAATMSGLIAAGLLYVVLSMLIRLKGDGFIHKLLPAVVVGPVIMSIGLILSPVAVNLAMGKTGDGSVVLVPFESAIVISMIALFVTVFFSLLGKGMFKLIPILAGIIVGYIVALMYGIVDFSGVSKAAWFAMPNFTAPEFNWQAIIFILPIAIAPAIEHIGDMLAISNVTKEDYLKKPGLKNTLLGDGLATSVAALFGGPPNTTYSEVTGAVTITKAYNPAIMTWAAIFAIALAFVGKIGGVLSTIPTPVMGGIMLLLFGIIATLGISTLIKDKTDFTCPRNMIIVSMILVFSIGGMTFNFGGVPFSGIGLGAIVGILLNLVLPQASVEKE
ncbi:uracil-xanthine permease family protein [Poseidonibacter ostreae]|jgi:uracil permease|uniref:Uracil permease n=1 Tax=Poseidonibacter ostreae TaxID=2654171 RepID=A0A6L4WNC3_9BACT|nr:uracil-xanthine permease family protein [Poseidonibacter ostreae]KAB7884876.1 uracil permease [Poseidonibacter ostreae]KAB7885743.1 uracil permease [Poseidonibacter ostreae]KAB7893028.1 uracil permease [Poseidonibacter ostreae]MAC85013.1 uracil permease [Arcobacter sp.]|tara:strand:+ start:3410 stop:4654 length:1245 start_codon:yes stop_codon:yes gene_type:complete